MTADAPESQHALALRPGVLLADRYRLVRSVRGTSPFAFSYHAEDLTTGDTVVVKEFFPRSLVSRGTDGVLVRPHSAECERDFLRALHRFALEGSVLAESSHPNLVRVYAVINANATAYFVMKRHETRPLVEYVKSAGGRITSTEAGRLVQHLLSALQVLHTDSIIHRDLSPRSVHVDANGSALLLEFSARRHLPVHATDLASGFAAFEQYGMRDIGPWTDVYAVSALLYYMLMGSEPPSALDRAAGEAVISPLTAVPGVSAGLARLAVKGMALLPQQRPHAVSELRRQLENAIAESAAPASRSTPSAMPSEITAADLAAAMDVRDNDDSDRTAPLRLAAGGIVVPGEDRGIRLLRMLGSAASRLRRTMAPGTLTTTELPEFGANEARQPRAATRPAEPPPVVLAERPVPVASVPLFSAANVPEVVEQRRPVAEQSESIDLATELSLASETMQTQLSRQKTRRRYSIAAASALVLAVGSSLVLLARNGRASGIRKQDVPSSTSGVVTPVSMPAANDAHVAVDGGAVLQSTSRSQPSSRAEAEPQGAKHTATQTRATQEASASAPPPAPVLPSSRLPNVKIALSGATPDLRIVPPELLVDPRTRLTNGEDQIEQGEYVTARRTFRTAMQQLDSAATRYPESQAIKNLRRELEQADARAGQACTAENEMRKRRGEQARACQ